MIKETELRKMLMHRSKNRGCKELDIILGYFAELCLDSLGHGELLAYVDVLAMDDLLLYDAILGRLNIRPSLKLDGESIIVCGEIVDLNIEVSEEVYKVIEAIKGSCSAVFLI